MLFFFFQAEDGIRDYKVTGVQTCALPIFRESAALGDAEVEARAADDRSVALAGIIGPFGDLHRAHDLRDHEVDVGVPLPSHVNRHVDRHEPDAHLDARAVRQIETPQIDDVSEPYTVFVIDAERRARVQELTGLASR